MKRFGNPLLSFAAFFLILLAILGLFYREGKEKVQTIPSFVVGGGLIIASGMRRTRRRRMLLKEIRTNKKEKN
tara:strand:- start:513 stop:731 length:219 start_codon:yes stop_codon:yes gene_type:complete